MGVHISWFLGTWIIDRDLTQMRTGGQRTAFEIPNCRNVKIHSCYLLLLQPILASTFKMIYYKFITDIVIHVISLINLSETRARPQTLMFTKNRQNKLSYVAKKWREQVNSTKTLQHVKDFSNFDWNTVIQSIKLHCLRPHPLRYCPGCVKSLMSMRSHIKNLRSCLTIISKYWKAIKTSRGFAPRASYVFSCFDIMVKHSRAIFKYNIKHDLLLHQSASWSLFLHLKNYCTKLVLPTNLSSCHFAFSFWFGFNASLWTRGTAQLFQATI